MSDSHFWSPDQTIEPRRARRIGSTIPNENISFGSTRQQLVPMRERGGDCQSQGAGSGRPGERPFELSLICHVLVTVRDTQVLLRTAALSGVGLPGAGSGLLRRWRTGAAMSTLRPGGARRRSHRAPCALSKRDGTTIPLASKVPTRADWGRQMDGRIIPAQHHPLPRPVRAVSLLSRSYGSASRLSRSPSIAASSSRIPAISAASSRSTVLASLRCRDRPRGEANTSTRRRSPRSPRR